MRHALALTFTLGLGFSTLACARVPSSEAEPRPAETARSSAASASASPPSPPAPPLPPLPQPRAPFSAEGGPRAVRAEFGAVTSVEPHATRAGIAILEQGGNAVDAAVAVAYALAVTHPSAGNLGGGGFLLVRPKGGPTSALDFRETAPLALTRARFDAMQRAGGMGPISVGVPGSVAGLELAHDRFGRLPRAAVLAPAIELARGHRLGVHQAALLAGSWHALSLDPTARAIFGQQKQPLSAGQRLVQRDLAATLTRISEQGREGFYTGATASALVGLARGLITSADLTAYQAKWREPLRFDYHGLALEVMPPPSAGGVAVTQMLLMLQALHAEQLAHDSAAEMHLFIEAARRAQVERRYAVIDPDALSPLETAQKRARWLNPRAWLDPSPIDPEHATPSASLRPPPGDSAIESEHTTHFSVVDGDGMVVSCTTTLSASYGAKLVVPGTGVVLNNSVASFSASGDNQPVAGRRTVSSMAPVLVLDGNDVVLALGTPGGDTIPNTIVQVLRHIVDHGESLSAAVDAPRLHHGFLPDVLRYEPRNAPPSATLRELTRRGHKLRAASAAIGDANELLIQGKVAWAYADPREFGLALAAKPAPTRLP
ncbi:MAG TPA: gamma-glutamyltransferase [Polyangiaceae bacterium]|nr:gamma-glutamyltransferase [Polyangiaceae bacterium]